MIISYTLRQKGKYVTPMKVKGHGIVHPLVSENALSGHRRLQVSGDVREVDSRP